MIPRYWLFGGQQFYATGGFNDCVSQHNALDILRAEAEAMERAYDLEWWHIVDMTNGEIILRSDYAPYGSNEWWTQAS